jgi:hypothetical protein
LSRKVSRRYGRHCPCKCASASCSSRAWIGASDAKGKNTHIIVERIVADIDDIVKKVRFPDWQHTSQGERLVQRELRRTLSKYKLHTDRELFDKAYEYIRQYY